MNSKVFKRVLSLVLVLSMVIVPMQVAAEGEESISLTENVVAAEVVADLSGLERPIEPPSDYENPTVERRGSGDFEDDIYIIERQKEMPAGEFLPLSDKDGESILRMPSTVGLGTRFQFNTENGKEWGETVSTGSGVNVWILDSTKAHLGTAFTSAVADGMRNEFVNNIRGLVTGIVGEPYFVHENANVTMANTINVLLFNEAHVGGGYIAGYFAPLDYMNQPDSNKGAILYMNVDNTPFPQDPGIFDQYLSDPESFNGTMAHEFQHLIGFSHYVKMFKEGKVPGSGGIALWANEGLSGMVDYNYSSKFGNAADPINLSHHVYMLADLFGSAGGHVPTDREWGNTGGRVYSNYGASAYQMITFGNKTSPKALIDDTRVGFDGTKTSIGSHFWNNDSSKSFNDFFTFYALNAGVSTPVATKGAVESGGYTAYVSPAGYNEWIERGSYNLGSPETAFMGVKKLNTSTSLTSGGRRHSYTLALSDTVGVTNNAIDITIPPGGAAKYYVVTPFNAKNVNGDLAWANADKIAAELQPGVNEVIVGTDNRFAVLAVNFETPLTGTVSYAAKAVKTIGVTGITTTPAALVSGEAGQKATITVTSDMIMDGAAVTVEVVKASDDSVVANAVASVTGNVITANAATLQVDFNQALLSGKYKFKVSADGVSTMSPTFIMSMSVDLDTPAAGAVSVPTATSAITLKFGGAAQVGNGQVTIKDGAGTVYNYVAKAADVSGTAATLPIGEFVSSGKERLVLNFNEQYEVEVMAEAFQDTDGNVTGAKNLGIFTTEGELADPSVLPEKISLSIGEFSKLFVYFGTNQAYNSATLAVENEAIISIDKAEVTTSGEEVAVTALSGGTTNITLGFSGTPELTKTVAVTVTGRTASSGGSTGGSGSGYEGTNKVDVSPNVAGSVTSTKTTETGGLDLATAKKLATEAVKSAVKDDKAVAVVRVRNAKSFPLESLKAMAEIAEKAGKNITLHVDTTDSKGAVSARMTINPADATKDMVLSSSTISARAKAIDNVFAKHFENGITILSLDHADELGCKAEIAFKADKDQDTSDLKFYTYDSVQNTYKPITGVKYTVNTAGYVRFDTAIAGDFIVSDGALA